MNKLESSKTLLNTLIDQIEQQSEMKTSLSYLLLPFEGYYPFHFRIKPNLPNFIELYFNYDEYIMEGREDIIDFLSPKLSDADILEIQKYLIENI